MGIFAKAIERRGAELTTPLSSPAAWLWEAFGGAATSAGISVTPESALKYTAVYACVNALASDIAQVPWNVYRRSGKKKILAADRLEHWLLHNEPIGTMNSYSFRHALMVNVLLGGNAFVEIIRDGSARVKALRLLPWWTVMVYEARDEMSLVYQVTRRDGRLEVLDASDIIHIPCLALDGIAGLSPIAQHREAVGLGLAAEKSGSAFFGNGSRPSGYLSVDKPMRKEEREDLESKWFAKFGSSKNTGKVPVMSGGLKWTQLSIPPADAQFIETRIFQAGEICLIYNVQPVRIGLADKSAKSTSVDSFLLSHVKFSLAPWASAIEHEFNRKLFPNTDAIYSKLDLNGLLRGDPKTRAEFYKTMWATGSFSANDILDWEEMDQIEGGERHFVQQGFMPLDRVDDVIDKQGAQAQKPKQDPEAGGTDAMGVRSHANWLSDVAARVAKWERRDDVRVADAFMPVFLSFGNHQVDPAPFCRSIAAEFDPADAEFALRSIERFAREVMNQ